MSPPTLLRLSLPRAVYADMVAHALAERPLECCGLLAGFVEPDGTGRVVRVYRLVNELASPEEYASEPRSLFVAARDMRERGLGELAVYHSHPATHPVPSPRDLARNNYPNAAHFIVSLAGDAPAVRAWWLTGRDYREAEWAVESGPQTSPPVAAGGLDAQSH
jgi:proteasome lid subunit RPN8/RPN11